MTSWKTPFLLVSLLSLQVLAAADRPNIVWVFTDDHAFQAISAYGSRVNQTPNIDRIAKEGMLFKNCFVTNSICGPSRAVILTGKHNHLNGFMTNGDSFDGSQQTFPKLLQKAGYQTAIFGKWHLKTEPTGFDDWEVLRGQGPYYNPKMRTPEGDRPHTGYTTDIVTDLALNWLENKRDISKPFMLMCQHKAPHRPWEPNLKHLTLFDDKNIPEPDTLFTDYSKMVSGAQTQTMTVAEHLNPNDLKLNEKRRGFNEEQQRAWDAAYVPKNEAFKKANLSGDDLVRWKYQRYAKDYLRCVHSVDENIGRLLEYLDAHGLSENTVVMYASDQGWWLGENGWFDKRWMYDVSFKTPFLAKWPGVIKPNSVNLDLVQNLDFAQTFLEMAGVDQPADMQGRSLVPIMKGETPTDWRQSLYYHYYEFPGAHSVRRHYGVRTQDYKLIHYYNTKEWEFFDMKFDPIEHHNLYTDPAYADRVAELKAELTRLREVYAVPEDTRPIERKRRKPKQKRAKANT